MDAADVELLHHPRLHTPLAKRRASAVGQMPLAQCTTAPNPQRRAAAAPVPQRRVRQPPWEVRSWAPRPEGGVVASPWEGAYDALSQRSAWTLNARLAHTAPRKRTRRPVHGRTYARVCVGWVCVWAVEGQHTGARNREQDPIAPRLDRVCV